MPGPSKIDQPEPEDLVAIDRDEMDGPARAIRAGVPTLPGEDLSHRDQKPARLPEDVEDRFTIH